DLTANIANLGADGDSSSVLDSKGKPIMLMLKFGENAQILDCSTGLLLLSTIHRGDDNVVLTTPENEELANIVQHRSVLGKTGAECSITGLVFVADSNSSIVISHPSRGEVARVRWDKNNYEGHHFEREVIFQRLRLSRTLADVLSVGLSVVGFPLSGCGGDDDVVVRSSPALICLLSSDASWEASFSLTVGVLKGL
ncbi:hypothetical protein FOZ62_007471, partial [Perkinsus olseni]